METRVESTAEAEIRITEHRDRAGRRTTERLTVNRQPIRTPRRSRRIGSFRVVEEKTADGSVVFMQRLVEGRGWCDVTSHQGRRHEYGGTRGYSRGSAFRQAVADATAAGRTKAADEGARQ